MQFEFYVLNYEPNKRKVINFNIFNNICVQERTEKEIKKYLRSSKKYIYEPFNKNEKVLFGFEALCKKLERIIAGEEWGRREYEISVSDAFVTEISDILREVERGNLTKENIYDELQKIEKRNPKLEKWDAYSQTKPNIEIIAHTVLRQYKEQVKKGEL